MNEENKVKYCKKCGFKLSSNATYCLHCGYQMNNNIQVNNVSFEEPSIKESKYCPKCGMERIKDDIYCIECGHKYPAFATNSNNRINQPKEQKGGLLWNILMVLAIINLITTAPITGIASLILFFVMFEDANALVAFLIFLSYFIFSIWAVIKTSKKV